MKLDEGTFDGNHFAVYARADADDAPVGRRGGDGFLHSLEIACAIPRYDNLGGMAQRRFGAQPSGQYRKCKKKLTSLKKWGLTPFSPLDLITLRVVCGEKGCLSPFFQACKLLTLNSKGACAMSQTGITERFLQRS
jgi:hypothetical protein